MKIRQSIQRITSKHIVSKEDIKEFLYDLIYTQQLGLGFHPDTEFKDYFNFKVNKPTFNHMECDVLEIHLNEAFEACKENNLDIYTMGLEISQPLIDKMNL